MLRNKKETTEKKETAGKKKVKAAAVKKPAAKAAAGKAVEKKAVKKAVKAAAKPRKAKAAVPAVEAAHPVKPAAHAPIAPAHAPAKPAAPAPIASKPAAPAPVTPKPVAPAPVAPKPAAHAPIAPAHAPVKPAVPASTVSKPVAPAPVAPKPVAPAPVAPKPVAPASTAFKPAAPVAPKPAAHAPVTPAHAPARYAAPAPAAQAPAAPAIPQVRPENREIELNYPVVLKDLAVKLQLKPSEIIKILMGMKVMATINQMLDETLVLPLCQKLGVTVKKALDEEEQIVQMHAEADESGHLKPRPPIVTFMGHVDHGKTSLLDAIRKTKVVDSEHGGITQHIGAYRVTLPHGEITFLDTPGHEAFTAMRARGAKITDIVVLVVAADDGVMPQTKEAIDHAKAAGVSLIVAMNKIDKPGANPDMVKKQLSQMGLMSEDWGGKTITVPVSAKTGQGIDDLLEMILLEAQMLELKANPDRLAKGVIVEAKLSKGRGPVATLLVQNGTLRHGDNIIVGQYYGKIRAMLNAFGHPVKEAGPAYPVEVLGLSGVPVAGEQFLAVEDEKAARDLSLKRQEKEKQSQMKAVKRISLEDLHAQIVEGKIKELKIIVKSDVQGSLEAIKDVINKLNISEIKLEIIHEGVGSINSSDVILAVASDALILGFNVNPDDLAKELIAKEGVDCKVYNVIYELANDIKAAVEGMLEPKIKKVFMGKVEIRKVMRLSKAGTIAGCYVTKGKITRSAQVDLVRNGEVVFSGTLHSLKRFKDDVREVMEGFECGIALNGYDAYQEGDIIEAHTTEKIARTL